MNTSAAPVPDELVAPEHNITAKELNRDLLSLQLPERPLVASDEECAALYPPGVYDRMIQDARQDNPA